ncbi:MAG: M23 family metallopeptidase [Clostridia bacterium]|nr:M23 family metallopeptidase [Clostridia bacterium]
MFYTFKLKSILIIIGILLCLCLCLNIFFLSNTTITASKKAEYIKWMEFNINAKVMNDALSCDIETNEADYPISWIDIIAYLAAKNGNSFKDYKSSDIRPFVDKIKEGCSVEELTGDLKYFDYYKETYSAVLSEFAGSYTITGSDGEQKQKYGLKAYSPIAEGFAFSHYDDFGASRSFGFKRKHLGNDLLGRIGTPIVAIEGGTVEAMGWNRYGGWRIGIRSFDKKRYYYYAHLRKDHPYQSTLKEGDTVKAGEVIGYLGMTGYSNKENVNNINIPHLHIGMQIIFDESQKDGNNEIWIDMYNIIEFLNSHRSTVIKNQNGEYEQKYNVESTGDGIVDY